MDASADVRDRDRLPRPRRELERALQHVERNSVILTRSLAAGIRRERLHLRALVVGAVRIADFQVERVPRDDPEEDAAMIEADAAEHRFRRDVADLGELIQHERPESIAHAQRSQRPRPLHALLRLHSRQRLYARPRAYTCGPCLSAADWSVKAPKAITQDRRAHISPRARRSRA